METENSTQLTQPETQKNKPINIRSKGLIINHQIPVELSGLNTIKNVSQNITMEQKRN